jgi:hypothetical protein
MLTAPIDCEGFSKIRLLFTPALALSAAVAGDAGPEEVWFGDYH